MAVRPGEAVHKSGGAHGGPDLVHTAIVPFGDAPRIPDVADTAIVRSRGATAAPDSQVPALPTYAAVTFRGGSRAVADMDACASDDDGVRPSLVATRSRHRASRATKPAARRVLIPPLLMPAPVCMTISTGVTMAQSAPVGDVLNLCPDLPYETTPQSIQAMLDLIEWNAQNSASREKFLSRAAGPLQSAVKAEANLINRIAQDLLKKGSG